LVQMDVPPDAVTYNTLVDSLGKVIHICTLCRPLPPCLHRDCAHPSMQAGSTLSAPRHVLQLLNHVVLRCAWLYYVTPGCTTLTLVVPALSCRAVRYAHRLGGWMRRWSCTSAWRGSGEPALAVLHLASCLLHRARASWRKVWACALHGVRRLPVWWPLWSFAAPPTLALDLLAGGFAFAIALTCVRACMLQPACQMYAAHRMPQRSRLWCVRACCMLGLQGRSHETCMTCNVQRDDTHRQHATHNMLASCNRRHASRSIQHGDVQHTTWRRATHKMATCNMKHASPSELQRRV
jgi:hypothetical protein